MSRKLLPYIVDTETTGLKPGFNDVIEVSFYRLSDNEQKSWCLKPINPENIEMKALEVNKVSIDDLLWKTEEGKIKYREPEEVLPEIENWIADDNCKIYDRILVGHNINFDSNMLKALWSKAGCFETFPFSIYGNEIDTKGLSLFFDYIEGLNNEKYNLMACIKKFGLEQRKAHGAVEDVKMTRDLFNYFCKKVEKAYK